jgi:hypothetical protein
VLGKSCVYARAEGRRARGVRPPTCVGRRSGPPGRQGAAGRSSGRKAGAGAQGARSARRRGAAERRTRRARLEVLFHHDVIPEQQRMPSSPRLGYIAQGSCIACMSPQVCRPGTRAPGRAAAGDPAMRIYIALPRRDRAANGPRTSETRAAPLAPTPSNAKAATKMIPIMWPVEEPLRWGRRARSRYWRSVRGTTCVLRALNGQTATYGAGQPQPAQLQLQLAITSPLTCGCLGFVEYAREGSRVWCRLRARRNRRPPTRTTDERAGANLGRRHPTRAQRPQVACSPGIGCAPAARPRARSPAEG